MATRAHENSASLNGSESGGGLSPARFFASSGPATTESTQRGKKGRTMNPPTQFQKITILPILIALPLVFFGFSLRVAAQGVPGTYELTFCPGSILYVNEEVIFHAYVADSLGVPATAGSVVFQICSRGGVRGGFGSPTPGRSGFASSISHRGVESPTAPATQKMSPGSPNRKVQLRVTGPVGGSLAAVSRLCELGQQRLPHVRP